MAATNVSEQQVLDALRHIPAERWGDVIRFLDDLKAPSGPPPGEPAGPPIRTAADVLQSGLVGIWGNRTDIGDSREFARRLRYEAEHRWERRDARGH
jgi:hypothetical protein